VQETSAPLIAVVGSDLGLAPYPSDEYLPADAPGSIVVVPGGVYAGGAQGRLPPISAIRR
jgi:hypothetical protein